MERVEQITRSVLNVQTVKPSENLHSAILDEVLKSSSNLKVKPGTLGNVPFFDQILYAFFRINIQRIVSEAFL